MSIVGILVEQKRSGNPLSYADIEKAVFDLYDGWDNLPADSKPLLIGILENDDPEALYEIYREEEKSSKEALITFEKDYPGVTNVDNVNDILSALKQRK